MGVSVVLAGVAALLFAFWLYFTWHFNYWAKRGVPSCNAFAFTGDRGGGFFFRKPFWTILDDVYYKYKGQGHRFAGFFQARQPILVSLDPELTKTILTKEFSAFQSRGQPIDEENDPMSANLFNLDGPRWKNLRAKLSPVFTSGKLKVMFPLMVETGHELDVRLKELAQEKGCDGEVDMKDLLIRYCTDVIGSVAFGISCNSIKGATNEFYTMTREVFNRNFLFIIRFFLISIHPIFIKLMPFKSLFSRTTSFFLTLMKDQIEYREKNNVVRNDLVHLMMQLRESDRHETDRVNHIEFNHQVMTGQAFLFFIAGLDSIANAVGYALHELALNPELQRRARDEVRAHMAKHGGMTYEALREMDLVERILRESLRKYCPVGVLMRKPSGPFKLPDSDVVIDERVMVWIPVWQTLHDPEYFPDPERFDPDRFTEEAKEARHHYAYVPFGEGPRFCIAERFAILEMKLCLAGLVEKHSFSVGKRTDLSLKFDPSVFSPTPKAGFWLKVEDAPPD